MTSTRAAYLCIASAWTGAFAAWHLAIPCAVSLAVVLVSLWRGLVAEMEGRE